MRDAWRASSLLCRLVANHTGALIEAEERGLAAQLAAEFPVVDGVLSDALTFCDVTTDPYGRPTTVEERLAEIHARYGPGHLVSRSIARSSDQLRDAANAIDRLVQPRSASTACH